MIANMHGSIRLSDGGEKPRVVPKISGTGCNLWLGHLVVSSESAAGFEELAIAAAEAAAIQRTADERAAACRVFARSPDGSVLCGTCYRLASDHPAQEGATP